MALSLLMAQNWSEEIYKGRAIFNFDMPKYLTPVEQFIATMLIVTGHNRSVTFQHSWVVALDVPIKGTSSSNLHYF